MDSVTKIFLMVAISWLGSELLKILIDTIQERRFSISRCFRYGGMPSSHSTFVTSLAWSILITEGFTINFLFALAIMIIVIRDLVVIRGSIAKNTEVLRKISRGRFIGMDINHTSYQIGIGMLIGMMIPSILLLVL